VCIRCAEEGYAATSTHAVAERAGARLSLVHYHFGSKRSLLLAVLEDLNERLLHRQQAMFSDGGRNSTPRSARGLRGADRIGRAVMIRLRVSARFRPA
jgi:AcrR family transcriptional regulator